jgi:hypothetical protein
MTARVLTLPRTRAGRDFIRRAMVAGGGAWDFPDGSRADETDWDELAVEIERDLVELDRMDAAMREVMP